MPRHRGGDPRLKLVHPDALANADAEDNRTLALQSDGLPKEVVGGQSVRWGARSAIVRLVRWINPT